MRTNISGILLLDKPNGMTSNGALQRVKRLFQAKKAGHTGSLDPIATGMLPICFGEATKLSQFLLDSDKKYRVVAKCGEETTTGDTEGEVIQTRPVIDLTKERLEGILTKFLGEQEQVPPMYSAVKYQGKPLYELARKGIEIERKARSITIYSLELESLDATHFTLHVHCSKGTYIRTLIEDMGRLLNCGAHVVELCRTAVAPYSAGSAYSLSFLESVADREGQQGLINYLLPVESAVARFPVVTLTTSAAFYLRMGQAVRASVSLTSSLVRLFSEDGAFLGLGEVGEDGRVKPYRLITKSTTIAVA